jgi:hypothetical protein
MDANQLIGSTSYASMPFTADVYGQCWYCSVDLVPANLYFRYNPHSAFNIFDPLYGDTVANPLGYADSARTNAQTMLISRLVVAGMEAQGTIPSGGLQRWDDTWVASFSVPFANEPGYVQVDRINGGYSGKPEFEKWRDWVLSHPQYWDADSDGGTAPKYMRSWSNEPGSITAAQSGFIAPMTQLNPVDCPPDLTSCTYGDLYAYQWSLAAAITGGYGMMLSDFTDGFPEYDDQTVGHGFNSRVMASFAAKYGYTLFGTPTQKSQKIVISYFNQWNDFFSSGYGNFFAALAKRVSNSTGREALVIDQCSGSPLIERSHGTDARLLATKIASKNYICDWDNQTIQVGRYGPIAKPIMTELGEVLDASYEPLIRHGLNAEADDEAFWQAIQTFYPELSAIGQTTVGYGLMKRLWIYTSWAHVADRSGIVRRANAFASRDYWDGGTLDNLYPLQSLAQTIIPTRPFGAAFYYSASAMRAAENLFGRENANLCGGNFIACSNEPFAVQEFLDGGGSIGYYVSDAALAKIVRGSANAPTAWVIPQDLFLPASTSPPSPTASMPLAEQASLRAIAPIVSTPSQLAALPNQPFRIVTAGGPAAVSASCKSLGYGAFTTSTSVALTGFAFYDQRGRLILVVSNPNPCPDAQTMTGTVLLSQVNTSGRLATGNYQLTNLFTNVSSTVNVQNGTATIPLSVNRWDTMVYAITL